jgi:transcriptional regulator with XRE-family HTH domain
VVNVVEERTYYPIVAGLVFSEGDPSSWSSADKGELWGDLLDSFERIWTDHFPEEEGPPSEVSVEAGEDSMLVRTSPEAAPVRLGIGVPFGPAMVSSEALEVVQNSHRVRLPSRLSNTPRLEDLVEREVEKLLEEEGDRAFTDLKKETGDPEERGRLLKKVYKAGGGEIVQLTAEGERRLKRTHGLGKPGFIERDQLGREFLVKMFETGKGGLLEIGLSWSGLAGPLVTEWVEQQKARAKQAQKELSEPLLFAELDQERREQVDRMVRQISLWKGGRLLMEVILGQVGRQGRNPVEIKADAFRVVLWPKRADARTWPPNWKQHVENILSTLMSLEFKYGGSLRGRVGESSFVSEWSYTPRGSGGHGEGVYTIRVGQIFLGCLAAFESGKERLRSGKESIRYNFRQKLPRGELGGRSFVTFDAGRPFYNAAAGLSPHQENLLTFLERQITLKGDGVRKDSRTKKAKKGTPEARERRQYGSDFCPILPEGQVFLGALGHFPNNAELGRTLYGTASKKARKHAGLIAEMGYVLPPGRAQSVREGVVQKALEDLKAVVVDYLGGVVVGHYGDVWVPLQDFGKMVDEDTLCRRLKILCFFPIDYETKRREKWEETVGRKATNDLREAERDAWTTTDEAVLKGDGNVADPPSGWPLHVRLHAAMKERDLRQKDLASLFGVSAPTISYWLKGTEPDENGEVRGKPIPEDVAPLMVRWIETEESPSSEELSVFKERRDRERKKALQRRKRLS